MTQAAENLAIPMIKSPARVANLSGMMLRRTRIALIRDFVEENWPSMDLVADMVFERLDREHAATLQVTQICPPLHRRFGRLPGDWATWPVLRNADRLDQSLRRLRPGPKAAPARVRSVSFDRP